MCKKLQKFISLNDIYLTVYFIILLISLILSMAFPLTQNDVRSSVDVVLRTAVAAMCGYFISSSFVEKTPPSVKINSPVKPKLLYQINVVALLGMFSLCVLIAARYSDKMEFSAGTLSQVRDLYLASVTFLMGNSRS